MAVKVNVLKHRCCCGWPDCAELASAHEHGDFTHQLPLDPDDCRSFLYGLGVAEDEHDAIVTRRCDEHEDIRYRHIQHYRCDRTFTKSGMPALAAETQHAHSQVRDKKVAPQPDRPRGGQDGVMEARRSTPTLPTRPVPTLLVRSSGRAARARSSSPRMYRAPRCRHRRRR